MRRGGGRAPTSGRYDATTANGDPSGGTSRVKIKAQAGVLAKLLQIVTRAVSNRSTIQLLSAVLFEAKGGLLKMSATDMELSISVAGRTEIEREGRTAIPARVLLEVVRSLPDGEISLEAEDGKATLAHQKNVYDFRTYDPKDFPVPQAFPSGAEGSGAPSFAVPIADLADTVQKVLPCVSKDEQRPVLTGVLVSFEDGRVRMVATDAYRMAMNAASLEGAPAQAGRAIIPYGSRSPTRRGRSREGSSPSRSKARRREEPSRRSRPRSRRARSSPPASTPNTSSTGRRRSPPNASSSASTIPKSRRCSATGTRPRVPRPEATPTRNPAPRRRRRRAKTPAPGARRAQRRRRRRMPSSTHRGSRT
jgi:hypothetical protein